MQVRGMLKGFIDLVSATKGVITCSTINPTGWVKTFGLHPTGYGSGNAGTPL